jgi:peroxiredoxin
MSSGKIISLTVGLMLSAIALAGCAASGSKTRTSSAPASADTSSSNQIGTAVGDRAPDFQLTGLDGAQLNLADLHGSPAVLVFWTAWCPVCKEEAPHINALAAKYEPQGVRVVGINIQDSPARTEGGIRDFGIKYRIVRDPDASVTRRYKVTGTPTVIFLDRSGVVRYFGNELPGDYPSRLAALMEQKS